MRLNEGLEKLGEKIVINGKEVEGCVFACSAVRKVKLPSTLKRIEKKMFLGCENLIRIEIPSGVEYIGEYCFSCSEIGEITLPSTLREIGEKAFDFYGLKTVFVEDSCTLDIK